MKSNKKFIIGMLFGILLASTVGVVAVKLTAKEIPFTSEDVEWQVDNVEDAMNDLFVLGKAASNVKIYKLGEGRSFNISDIVGQENVGKYTEENFIVVDSGSLSGSHTLITDDVNGDAGSVKYSVTKGTDFTLDYDEETGGITITGGTYTLKAYQIEITHLSSSKTFNKVPIVYFLDGITVEE